jgi:hypothetical protein
MGCAAHQVRLGLVSALWVRFLAFILSCCGTALGLGRVETPGREERVEQSSSRSLITWRMFPRQLEFDWARKHDSYPARGLPCERFTAALTSRTSCITRGRGGWLGLTPWKTFTSYPLPAFLAHSALGQGPTIGLAARQSKSVSAAPPIPDMKETERGAYA